MRTQSYLYRAAASLLLSVGLVILPGCSNLGSRTTGWAAQRQKHDTPPVKLGKIQSDENGRPLPGSQAPIQPSGDESKQQVSEETRSHVAMAMGEMLEGSGNLTGAQAQFERALKLDPKSLKAALALARIETRLGRHSAALRIYQNAEKQHRRSAAVFNDKGLLLAEQKDWAAAIAALRTAVKLEPAESKYHNNLGMVLAASGAFEDAWKEFREAVGSGPAHYNVALMMLQVGQTVEARNHLERAVAVMPSLREAEELLAQLDADGPMPNMAGEAAEVAVELEDVEQLTAHESQSNATVDPQVTPASATVPQVSSESNTAEPESASTPDDPWKKRWVPPKWLR